MIISFREGCSGNWLATLLTLNNMHIDAEFRQDGDGTRIPENVFHFDGNATYQTVQSVDQYNGEKFITCHSTDYKLLREIYPKKTIIRITPKTKIFQSISAAFYKLGPGDTATVDLAHEYISDYYKIFTYKDPLPELENSYIIDFGELSQIDSLTQICKTRFDVELKDNHIKFFNDYWSLQKEIVEESQLFFGISKDQLLILFDKKNSVFDRACFIYFYEKFNNLVEHQRKWSIDHVPDTILELSNFMEYRK